MKFKEIPKSPVFPQGKTWKVEKRTEGYESDATALLRALATDDEVREDQRFAWERWRNDETRLRKP